ncbi:MAG: hypothetical protein L6V93_19620 [Clostridiales bacterium]|nr:MAG: hypothetical protein L6V93_19620 [Clostridiales bacterium]
MSFAYHSFWQKISVSKTVQNAVIIAFLVIAAALIALFIVSLAKKCRSLICGTQTRFIDNI